MRSSCDSLMNKDVAIGLVPATDKYTMMGRCRHGILRSEIPEAPKPTCYILALWTCTAERYARFKNSSAIIKDYIMVEDEEGELETSSELELTIEEQHLLIEEL